ncbi:uncharacterized protein LOC103522618 [Diaphorina citri]|uniref:Uncharacterized protein LOC103522618 n=1 Tax=Diaphorina citri TaxID=121845 RepID=A0A3Q0JMS1_DIACI|nr:uncharacterized protein LOC103522618 [Diaphorina citri]
MTQEELVEMILEVLDEELPVSPYISPSEQALIDERLAEEERLRRLAAMDNFKERALMEMMDGVLELKWEDKLKKDVPKPPCMIKKVPDKWNEQDLNDVKEYEYKVEEMRKDRAKYKVMLLEEWEKITTNLKMRAAGLELAEAEATVQYHTRNVTSVKDRILHIKTQLAHMIGYQNDLEQDIIIQLNLCQGQVEMELTGHFEDFHRVHLITKNTINNINTKVKRAGSMKIAETQKSCRMRKMIVNQEWVQKKLKMSIENLKAHIKRTDRTKISRETLEFLRNEERGCVAKDTWLAKTDRDAEAMIAYYRDESDRLDAKLEAIEAKKLKLKHSLKEIDTRAREVHLSVSLTKMEKDKDFEEEYEQSRKAR